MLKGPDTPAGGRGRPADSLSPGTEPMEVKLVVIKGSTKTREIRLRGGETLIGRQSGCGLRIPSAMVSRRHCRLRRQRGSVTVEDLNSANGTFLNGVRVYGSEKVLPGDQLEIGPVIFVVEYARQAETVTPPPPQAQAPLARRLPPPLPAAIPLADDDFVEAIPLDEGDQKPTVMTPDAGPVRGRPAKPPVEDEVPLVLEMDESWHLPEGQDLRDLLSSADES